MTGSHQQSENADPPVCVNQQPPQISAVWLSGIVLLGLLMAFYGHWCFQAPVPAPQTPDGFQFQRAWDHLEQISGNHEPHPTGSEQHRVVRDYLITRLESLGYEVRSQDSAPMMVWESRTELQNLIATRPGVLGPKPSVESERRKILFACHYDSHPNGPGAGDDGAAVACLLELARLEMQLPAGKRDVVFLFSDGEEAGLLGARDWAEQCQWLSTIDLVFNFEARGSSGPSFLFETSPGNQELIRRFAQIAPRPTGNSLAYEVYRLMPNDTDFTVFKDHGMSGMNFAFVGGVENYHTPDDTPENLDPNSLSHHGQTAEALWKYYRDADSLPLTQANAVYFDVGSRFLIWWPESWNAVWLVVCLALYLACLFGCRLGSVRDIVFGIIGWLIVMVTMTLLLWITSVAFEQQQWFQPFWGRSIPWLGVGGVLAAFWCVAGIGWCLGGSLIECITKDKSLWVSVWGIWLLIACGVVGWLPGASYLFLIPITLACIFRLVGHYVRRQPKSRQVPNSGWLAEHPLFLTGLACGGVWILWMPVQRALLAGLGYRYPQLYWILIPLMISPAIPMVTVLSFRSKMIAIAGSLLMFGGLVAALFQT